MIDCLILSLYLFTTIELNFLVSKFVSGIMADVDVVIISNESPELPLGFHWSGEQPAFIFEESSSYRNGDVAKTHGKVLVVSIPVLKFIDNDNSYHAHFAWYSSDGSKDLKKRMCRCLICLQDLIAFNQQTARKHIASVHLALVPFAHLEKAYTDRITSTWQKILDSNRQAPAVVKKRKEEESQSSGGMKQQQLGFQQVKLGKEKIKEIRKVLCEGLCSGCLPINLIENKGNTDLMTVSIANEKR